MAIRVMAEKGVKVFVAEVRDFAIELCLESIGDALAQIETVRALDPAHELVSAMSGQPDLSLIDGEWGCERDKQLMRELRTLNHSALRDRVEGAGEIPYSMRLLQILAKKYPDAFVFFFLDGLDESGFGIKHEVLRIGASWVWPRSTSDNSQLNFRKVLKGLAQIRQDLRKEVA